MLMNTPSSGILSLPGGTHHTVTFLSTPRLGQTLSVDALPISPPPLTVGHFGRRCGVDLVDAGEGDVLPAAGDVRDVVDGPGRVEGPVHQDVGVQAEHLQEDEVAAGLEEVVLDLLHVAQAQAAQGLVDHVEGHLWRGTGQASGTPKVHWN